MIRRIGILGLVLCLLPLCAARADLTRSIYMEKDNIFQRRYNELTGAEVTSLFDTGMPYFFGGKPTNLLMSRYPEFAKRDCWESTAYYEAKKIYVYGLDCTGFLTWVRKQCKLPKLNSLGEILNQRQFRKNDLYSGGWNWKFEEQPLPPYEELEGILQVGDLLITRSTYRHVMIYIGTLSDYGFTAEEVPELADYLHYPLVIHCGSHPQYGERIQQYIDTHQDHCWNCLTTDGGVCVSILYVPAEAAPFHERVQATDFDWFLIDDGRYALTIRPTDNLKAFVWYRPDGK